MKKCEFYTVISNRGGIEALRVNGYTDGAYNYRKDDFGQWYAIVPEFGLSVAQARTRKEAAVIAHSKEVTEAVQRYIDAFVKPSQKNGINRQMHDRLKKLIEIKENAEKAA